MTAGSQALLGGARSDDVGRAKAVSSVAHVRTKKNLRMKAARVAADLSQAELAVAVGATRQTIGLIEAGGYNPTLKLCIAICKELGRTLDDLFWEEGE